MDLDAISAALAARFARAAVTAPTGYGNIRSSTADLPENLGALPAVLVFPDAGAFVSGNGTRTGVHRVAVRFYYARTVDADLGRQLAACRRWLSVLVDQVKGAATLGGAVAAAAVVDYRIGGLDYGGGTYTGIELGVELTTSEPWAATA